MAGTVVCGVDASKESQVAARAAGRLARRLGARPVVVHVLQDAKQGREHADAVLREIRMDRPVEVEQRVARGDPAELLAAIAHETGAKLVAVGSRGRGALCGAILGSTSMSAVRRCGCPVMVVPPGALSIHEAASSLVCGVDGSPESEHAACAAVGLSARLDLELVLVHVQVPGPPVALRSRGVHPPLDYREQLERARQAAVRLLADAKAAAGAPSSTRERIEQGVVPNSLERAAAVERAALIVVGSRGLGALGAAVVGSVSTRLAATARRPVLIVKQDAAVSFDDQTRSR